MNRALPGWAVDLIGDGVRPVELRTRGNQAVWSALVRTASSAYQRGWRYAQWAVLVSDPSSNLGRQARLKRGRTARTKSDFESELSAAWETAVKWVSNSPPAAEIDAKIAASIQAARDLAADCDTDLTSNERAVLRYAAQVAERNHTDRPAIPLRATAAALDLTERAVRTALGGLDREGLLILAIRGRAAASEKNRRASLYRLPSAVEAASPIPVPGNPVYAPPSQIYTPPDAQGSAPLGQIYASPSGGSRMVAVTLSSDDPDALAAALAALASRHPVQIEEMRDTGAAADNVRPLRRTASQSESPRIAVSGQYPE